MFRTSILRWLPTFELLDAVPGDGGGAGGGAGTGAGAGAPAAGAGAGAAATPQAGTANPGAAAAGAGSDARPGAETTGSQFVYTEDRSRWIPPHRLSEETQKRQSIEAQLAERDRQIAALTNSAPKDPATQKAEEVRTAFQTLFPHLTPLLSMSKEQVEALVQTPAMASRAGELEQRQWERHGNAQMTNINTQVAEAMGVDGLDNDQKDDVRRSFTGWLKSKAGAELEQSGGRESKTLQRYEDGDPELLKEFVTGYTKRWVEPLRRTATTQQLPRTRPTPNSQGRNAPVTSNVQRPEKFGSLDERLEYAVKLAKERGVQFGR